MARSLTPSLSLPEPSSPKKSIRTAYITMLRGRYGGGQQVRNIWIIDLIKSVTTFTLLSPNYPGDRFGGEREKNRTAMAYVVVKQTNSLCLWSRGTREKKTYWYNVNIKHLMRYYYHNNNNNIADRRVTTIQCQDKRYTIIIIFDDDSAIYVIFCEFFFFFCSIS